MLDAQPELQITLLCVSRGPVHVPINADSPSRSGETALLSPAPQAEYVPLTSFEQACEAHGLRAERMAVPQETAERVRAAQWPWLRAAWSMCGIWDSMAMYLSLIHI